MQILLFASTHIESYLMKTLIYLKSDKVITFGENVDSHSCASLGVICIYDVKGYLDLA